MPDTVCEVTVAPTKQPARTDWAFGYADTATTMSVISVSRAVVTAGILFARIIVAIIVWSRRRFSVPHCLAAALVAFAVAAANFANDWPLQVAGFSTAHPLALQSAVMFGVGVVAVILLAAAAGLVLGMTAVRRANTRAPEHPSTRAPEHPSTRAPEHSNGKIGACRRVARSRAARRIRTRPFGRRGKSVFAHADFAASFVPFAASLVDGLGSYIEAVATLALFLSSPPRSRFSTCVRLCGGVSGRLGRWPVGCGGRRGSGLAIVRRVEETFRAV
jgi:hypothetical protein